MYYQPILVCDTLWTNRYEWHNIVLPYAVLPDWDGSFDESDEDDEDFPWPENGWHATVACPHCGLIAEYDSDSVGWGQAPVEGKGTFQSDAAFVSVSLNCGQPGCRAPIQFYTATENRSEDSIPSLIRKLQQGFFRGSCPKGHSLIPVPKERYRIQRIHGAIPSNPGEPKPRRILC